MVDAGGLEGRGNGEEKRREGKWRGCLAKRRGKEIVLAEWMREVRVEGGQGGKDETG